MNATLTVNLVVRQRRMLTQQICEFELADPRGQALPSFEPGAHINVRTPGGYVRSYSLCNDPQQSDRYVIGVKRESGGRGGSVSMVDRIEVGDSIEASAPLNSFRLMEARQYLLIAGGIGITPILSMMRTLHRRGCGSVRLIYCTRTRAEAAFLGELDEFGDQVIVHHDNGRSEAAFDFWPVFSRPDGTHIYCCGPNGLMEHVRLSTMHWPASAIHFENFAGVAALGAGSQPFRVRRAATGETIEVAANETILDALQRAGYAWPSSCGSGVCGTCRMRVRAGSVMHRDLVLSPQERKEFMMPCVSRAASTDIELEF